MSGVDSPIKTTAGSPALSVVVPVHDEEDVLPELRRRLESALSQVPGTYEVVLVDDGSRDGSAALIEEWIADGWPAVLVVISQT